MSGTHALDLRERVIAAWRQGKSAIEAVRRCARGMRSSGRTSPQTHSS